MSSPSARHAAASPLLLALVFVQVQLSRHMLEREYGLQ